MKWLLVCIYNYNKCVTSYTHKSSSSSNSFDGMGKIEQINARLRQTKINLYTYVWYIQYACIQRKRSILIIKSNNNTGLYRLHIVCINNHDYVMSSRKSASSTVRRGGAQVARKHASHLYICCKIRKITRIPSKSYCNNNTTYYNILYCSADSHFKTTL